EPTGTRTISSRKEWMAQGGLYGRSYRPAPHAVFKGRQQRDRCSVESPQTFDREYGDWPAWPSEDRVSFPNWAVLPITVSPRLATGAFFPVVRSEERRVGKECGFG